MQTKRIATIMTVVIALTLVLAISSTVAGPPVEGGEGSGDITLAGTVASKVNYQGRLTDAAGNPLSGNYNLVFQLWDDATVGSQVGSDIVRNSVPVSNGLFTVELDVPQDAFNGQALWLRIQVNGQWLSPRQELLPVPYALSLRPGARIEGNSTDPVASVVNQGLGVALYAQGAGMGVEGVGEVGVRGQGQVGVGGEGLTGVSGTGSWVGVAGYTEGDASTGVLGTATGYDGKGVEGNAQFGTGVRGSGEIGVQGASSVAVGVRGEGPAAGVEGFSQSGTGVVGTSQATYGLTGEGPLGGVFGTSTGLGTGVEGRVESGSAVLGVSTHGDGIVGNSVTGVGVYGNTGSGLAAVMGEGPKGVYGKGSADYGEGVLGEGTGLYTEGVLGSSAYAHGVGGYSSGTNGGLAIGVYGQTAATWGLATNQNLYVGGSCTGCTIVFLGQNVDSDSLEVGDVVAISGIAPPLMGQQTPVLKVRRATAASGGALGVVQARAAVTATETPVLSSDSDQTVTVEMPGLAPGNVVPGDYLFVVVQGLVQVRADASSGAIEVGDPVGPVALPSPSGRGVGGEGGAAHKLDQDTPVASMLGRALEPLVKGTGLIWVLVVSR